MPPALTACPAASRPARWQKQIRRRLSFGRDSRCDVRTARRAVPTLRQFAEMFSRSSVRKQFHVRVNHDADKLVESYRRFPIENLFGFGSVTDQVLNFCWPLITWVVFDEFFPIKIDM